MYTTEAPPRPMHRQFPGGPPLTGLAAVSTVLFLTGLIASTAMAGATFPSPFDSGASILAYFHGHQDAVKVSAFFQFAAAVPLAIYAATASARLRNLGIRAPGASIAFVGGALAAAFLAISGVVSWALAQPAVPASPPLVRALCALSFAAGGPGSVVPLGLLIAGLAVPAAVGQVRRAGLANHRRGALAEDSPSGYRTQPGLIGAAQMQRTPTSAGPVPGEGRLLEGKITIITGASRGIGAAAARVFAAAGATVVLAARSEDDLEAVAAQIRGAGGEALAIPTDVADPDAAERLVRRTLEAFGRLDAAFNNAGEATRPRRSPTCRWRTSTPLCASMRAASS